MSSVYTRIFLWLALTLAFAFAGFLGTSWFIARQSPGPGDFVGRMHRVLLDELVERYEQEGAEALRAALDRLDREIGGSHFLVRAGDMRDVLTGSDMSEMIGRAPREPRRPPLLRLGPPAGRRVMVHRAADGRYMLVVEAMFPGNPNAWLPLYFWILLPVALFAWWLAARIAGPLRRLESTVERFGRGDLGARVNWSRRDEFGRLGRAFDEMADRIATLLTAERRLLQDVSHELRSPLARLRFATELARQNAADAAPIDRIERESARLTELVETLLEVTRAEGDPGEARRLPVDLSELLNQVVHDTAIEAAANGCRLALSTRAAGKVTGDPELLRRAVENVVRNAIGHAPASTGIDITLDERGGAAVIEVRDYGPGVPSDMLERIFHPFVRAEADRGRNSGGTGLGLSITARAMALHHGRAYARNAHPGLCVSLEIPLL